jgi:hypothetical protein
VVVGALVAVCALVWLLHRFGIGSAVGILVLGALDALPGPNLETAQIANSITAQDVMVVFLIALLVYENARYGFRPLWESGWGRALVYWTALFLAWYWATVIRTWLTTPVPLIHAVTFSRYYLYFALLLPLLFGPLRRRGFRNVVLAALAVGALVAALAQSAAVAANVSLSVVLHTQHLGANGGLIRLYTSAADIPFAALPLGFGLALFGISRRQRMLGAALAVSSLSAVLLGLTRATYLGEMVGLATTTVIVLMNNDARARLGRRQLAKAGLTVMVVIGALVAYSPPSVSNSAISGVSQRVSSLFADLTASTTTDPSLQARAEEISGIEAALGPHWLFGLGFLDPTYDYVADAPQGNINSVDVSLLGSIAMIGVFGTALYAIPLIAILLVLVYRRWTMTRLRDYEWLLFGGIAWCVAATVVSPTLGLFFNPAQVTGSALILALVAAVPLADTSPRGAPRLDATRDQ